MAKDTSNNSLVRIGQQAIARYSNALVKRSLEELRARSSTTLPVIIGPHVLLLSAEEAINSFFPQFLEEEGFRVDIVDCCINEDGIHQLTELISKTKYAVVISTNFGLSPFCIPSIVSLIKESYPATRVIAISGYSTLEFVLDLKRRGLDDFFTAPFELTAVSDRMKELLAK